MPQNRRKEGWGKVLVFAAIVLVALGLSTTLWSTWVTDVNLKVALLGVGVGVVATGVGFLGLSIAQKSEHKMKALANLAFDEKTAMMQYYEAYFRQNFAQPEFERFRWDLEAMAHVARWAGREQRIRTSGSVSVIIAALQGKVPDADLERIKSLRAEICG
jgi:hypothetical protein